MTVGKTMQQRYGVRSTASQPRAAEEQMIRLFLIAAAAFVLSVSASAKCPVTSPSKPPFVPPLPYRTNVAPCDGFWYGAKFLWTWVPNNPRWWLGGVKLVYWRAGFDARKEPQPD
jgi:hypothetical protein